MAGGKGKRGRGGRGASNSVGTRANPIVTKDRVNEEEEGQLTSGKEGQGATGGEKTGTKRKKQDESDEEEDWGLEGKSFWKSRIPQSVDTACYVMDQLPPN